MGRGKAGKGEEGKDERPKRRCEGCATKGLTAA